MISIDNLNFETSNIDESQIQNEMSREQRITKIVKNYKVDSIVFEKSENFHMRKFTIRRYVRQTDINNTTLQNYLRKKNF